MIVDPFTLARLVDESARAAARVQSYLVTGEQPDDEEILLRDAEVEFHRSNATVRRWVKEGFGVEKGGKLYLLRSRLRQFRKI